MSIEVLGKCASTPPYIPIPLFSDSVAAGFPSPAQDFVEKSLDLNEHLVTIVRDADYEAFAVLCRHVLTRYCYISVHGL